MLMIFNIFFSYLKIKFIQLIVLLLTFFFDINKIYPINCINIDIFLI